MEEKLSTFDLADYVYAGEGANSKSYNSKSNPEEMLKLFSDVYPVDAIREEVEVARKVWEIGVPSPKPGELVSDGKQLGIRFWRIPNKVSFARAVANNPEQVDKYAKQFAQMCKDLHSKHCKPGLFPDNKQHYLEMLAEDTAFNADEKKKIENFIKSVPDTDTCLHGDMHFGNVVTDGTKNYFIDLGEFATGYPLFDVAMLYIVCVVNVDDFIYENFHFHKDLAEKFWKAFVPEYFGKDKTLEEVDSLIKPFAAVKSLLIERNLGGVMLPIFENLFRTSILAEK